MSLEYSFQSLAKESMLEVDENIWRLIEIKAYLLSIGVLKISKNTVDVARTKGRKLAELITAANLYSLPWLFLKLNDRIRVRMIVDNSGMCQ
jgi:hypothetical protein